MSTYRPNYDGRPQSCHDLPPPPLPSAIIPPLPYGPPPPYDSVYRRGGDSWRPSDPPERMNEFTFRNDDAAPQYPREQDYLRPTRSMQYAKQENSRPGLRRQHRDGMNLNRAKRSQYYQSGRVNRKAPSERPLLRHQDDGKSSNEQLLGMTGGRAGLSRFMPAEDLSDSDEEQMDESDSDVDRLNADNSDLVNGSTNGSELEPSAKRRALNGGSRDIQDGASQPKWSNPDPYTVLPPVDDSQRKRKDVVKLIRKARNESAITAAERSQVAANDDFISFGSDDADAVTTQEVPASPGADWHEEEYGAGMPGAPSGPRQFSHLENLHNQAVPGISGKYDSAPSLGPPPDLSQPPSGIAGKIALDKEMSAAGSNTRNETAIIDLAENAALGSRKRTHDDVIKDETDQSDKPNRKGKRAPRLTGSLIEDWIPFEGIDATPWLRKAEKLTANAGFRLHKEVCDFYDFVKPQEFEQAMREELLSRLQSVINKHMPHCGVHCFGSFAAGLYLPTADMDVVIISDNFRYQGQKVVCQNKTQMFKLSKFLESSQLARPGSLQVVTGAKVPIIKFVDRITAIRVDVSFENDTGIVANDTFAAWRRQFPAMPVLVTVIKQFLMMRGLNEVQFGGLGGFSVTCLVTSLLQNMPRVQTGELIPEEHLGEMLIEFLDFYGNRLDTTRTGIMMNPPGYFDKQAYNRPSLRGPVYKANKVDRLAIMDPNNPANDISGGSKEVMCIFDRFSQAHAAILTAMKDPNRASLLDWSLGGNYESFSWQRNHLLSLHKERFMASAGISDLDGVLEPKLPSGKEQMSETRSAAAANVQAPQVPPKSKKSRSTKKDREKASTQRADSLRRQYPDMKDIPLALKRSTMKKLVLEYEREKKAMGLSQDSIGENSSSKKAPKVDNHGAIKGKNKHGTTKGKKKGTAQIKAGRSGVNPTKISEANRTAVRAANLPARPPPPAQMQGTYPVSRQPAALNGMPNGTSRSFHVVHRQSNKMAPLSDSRLAEVTRNLSGYNHNNPINLD